MAKATMSAMDMLGEEAGIDLLNDPEVQKEANTPQSRLEKTLSEVNADEAMASSPAAANFKFRSLLSEAQQAALKKSAPAVAERMIKDYNQILEFGAPVLEEMNKDSEALLEEQKHIKIPEADDIVNNLMRELDGYNAKYRDRKTEEFFAKIKKWFGGAKYSLETMVRDSKPIAERLNLVAENLYKMEINLGENIIRARKLHESTIKTMDKVVAVLAALEEISEYLHEKFSRADAALNSADENGVVEFDGETYSFQEFKEFHADLAQGISEVEKTWHDWRSQFFIGFATAPTLRNLIMVSASMKRRLLVFRTQGIPAARRSLAMWQQAALATQSAEMGDKFREANEKLLVDSFGAAATAVDKVAKASQAPLLSEEGVFKVLDSVRRQADSLVAADKWGRDMRDKSLAAFERAEQDISTIDVETRRKLVESAISAAQGKDLPAAPKIDSGDDLMGMLAASN